MAIINTGAIAKALWPGVNHFFGMSYAEFPEEFRDLFSVESSEKNFEEDVNVYGLGLMKVKPEAETIQYDSMAQGFLQRYIHLTYALGFIISREAVDDNQYMELAEKRAKRLAWSAHQTKENVCANVFNRATNTSYVGADGLCLANASHKLSKGGTFSNILTAAALSEASLESMIINCQGFVDDAGLKIHVIPKKLMIPKELQFNARRILGSDLQNDTANNALNAMKSAGVLPEGVKVNHSFSSPTAHGLITDVPDGLKLFERRALAMDNDVDFDSENMKFKASERFCVGWTDPRGLYFNAGA